MATKSTKTTKSDKTTKTAAKASKSSASAAKSTKPASKTASKSSAKSGTAKASTTKAKTSAAKATTSKSAATTSAAKSSSTATKSAKSTKAKKSAKSKADRELLAAVKPLIGVRQMREFSSKRVTKAELDTIAEVARWSGSSRNEQSNRYIALRNAGTIREIAERGLPQTRGLPTATAAIVIVEPDEPERGITRAFDDGRASERILIAANMLGLAGGISRVRNDVREPINELLGLPANRSVRTIVALGHPTADALAPKSAPGKARLPREEVVYDEGWPTRTESS